MAEKYTPKPNKGGLFARGYDKDDQELFHYEGYLDVDGAQFDLCADVRLGSGPGQPLAITLKRKDNDDSPFDESITVTLTRNDNKRNARVPDYSGSFSLADAEYSLAGWLQVSQAGRPYLNLKVKRTEQERWAPDDGKKDPLFG
jgi:hypothetical protein